MFFDPLFLTHVDSLDKQVDRQTDRQKDTKKLSETDRSLVKIIPHNVIPGLDQVVLSSTTLLDLSSSPSFTSNSSLE